MKELVSDKGIVNKNNDISLIVSSVYINDRTVRNIDAEFYIYTIPEELFSLGDSIKNIDEYALEIFNELLKDDGYKNKMAYDINKHIYRKKGE